jgi:hypothetical protein
LIQLITNAIDEKGLKATAKGNLPQKLCKEAIVEPFAKVWKPVSLFSRKG